MKALTKKQAETVGLTVKDSNALDRAYLAIFSKDAFDGYLTFGQIAKAVKESAKANDFTKHLATRYPEMHSTVISNCIWLADNIGSVDLWRVRSGSKAINPTAIKNAMRNELKKKDATADQYELIGLKPPKDKGPDSKTVDSGDGSTPNIKADDTLIRATTIDKADTTTLMQYLETITRELESRRPKEFSHGHNTRLEAIAIRLVDIYHNNTGQKENKQKAVSAQ